MLFLSLGLKLIGRRTLLRQVAGPPLARVKSRSDSIDSDPVDQAEIGPAVHGSTLLVRLHDFAT